MTPLLSGFYSGPAANLRPKPGLSVSLIPLQPPTPPLIPRRTESRRRRTRRRMKLMAANLNLPLARAIAGYLERPLVDAAVGPN